MALARHPISGQIYAVVHGRDDLDAAWPKLYTARDGARQPGEEFIRIEEGDDYGWPYCYYDWERKRKVLSPDYAGDGKNTGRCAGKKAPMMALPGRTGPMSLLFYKGSQLPARYRDGAFVTMHGPHRRTPHSPDGYKVVFVPFKHGIALDMYEAFADGFAVTTAGLPRFRPSVWPKVLTARSTCLTRGADEYGVSATVGLPPLPERSRRQKKGATRRIWV